MSFHDRPTAEELLAAVRAYLMEEVAATDDRRARFRALIAANVLAIASREIAARADDEALEERLLAALDLRSGTADERRASFARAIREGHYDDPESFERATAYARETVLRELAIANPKFYEAVS